MALTKCRECGGQVSTEATTCPHCGAPVKKQPEPPEAKKGQAVSRAAVRQQSLPGWLLIPVAIVIVYAVWWFDTTVGGDSPTQNRPQAQQEQQGCAKTDLSCLGNKGIVAAGVYCKTPIEHLALHDVKWTDGYLDMKFSEFRWAPEGDGAITYVGDKAEFQNGFGAYTPVVYEGDLASDEQTVLAVRIVREGRLHDGD